jgi:acyl-CoA thioester hydrolase
MEEFRYWHPIEVRYGDLDPQGHLNNAKYLTFMEQARIQYIKHLDLWDGDKFLEIGIILADVRVTFLAPIEYTHQVQVGVRVTRLGNKSIEMVYSLRNPQTRQEYASGSTVLVAYDYHSRLTIPIPDNWRTVIQDYEGLGNPAKS